VWVTEGEKDADNAARQGIAATTNPGGAAAFPAELADQLTGRRIAIIIDRDRAGYTRGRQLHDLLGGHAADLQILAPAPTHHKADLTDHIEAGHWDPSRPSYGLTPLTVADLVDLADTAPR
jgi:hypothetical protein